MRNSIEALRWPLGVPRLDTAPNRALLAVLDELRRQRGSYMFLRVARRFVCSARNSACCSSSRSTRIRDAGNMPQEMPAIKLHDSRANYDLHLSALVGRSIGRAPEVNMSAAQRASVCNAGVIQLRLPSMPTLLRIRQALEPHTWISWWRCIAALQT